MRRLDWLVSERFGFNSNAEYSSSVSNKVGNSGEFIVGLDSLIALVSFFNISFVIGMNGWAIISFPFAV